MDLVDIGFRWIILKIFRLSYSYGHTAHTKNSNLYSAYSHEIHMYIYFPNLIVHKELEVFNDTALGVRGEKVISQDDLRGFDIIMPLLVPE